MPVFMLEKIDVLSQLRKRSQLDENWHLIGKDILNPFGAKHRAIFKHKTEQGKKGIKFTASTSIQKEIQRSNTKIERLSY